MRGPAGSSPLPARDRTLTLRESENRGWQMRRLFVPSFAASLVMAGVLLVGGPAGAHGLVVVNPGESIQAAIDAADQHTTIVVRPGTYAENLLITTDRITLIGQGATLVPPATLGPGAPCATSAGLRRRTASAPPAWVLRPVRPQRPAEGDRLPDRRDDHRIHGPGLPWLRASSSSAPATRSSPRTRRRQR